MSVTAEVRGRRFNRRQARDIREMIFLAQYYSDHSPSKGNIKQSALYAGYSENMAVTKCAGLLKRYEDCSFQTSARALGITKPFLAWKLKEILDLPVEKYPKEFLAAIRLILANLGETTDQTSGGTVNFQGPTMVIIGASKERIKALREAAPQLSKEEAEEAENQRVQQRLDEMREGKSFLVHRHSKSKAEEEPCPQEHMECITVENTALGKESSSDAGIRITNITATTEDEA